MLPFLILLALHTKKKRYGQMGLASCYLLSHVMSASQSFRPMALLFSGKGTFWGSGGFKKRNRKGCGHIDMIMAFPW